MTHSGEYDLAKLNEQIKNLTHADDVAAALKEIVPEFNHALKCTEEKIATADRDVVYMHALPADRNNEVENSVIDGPHSIVYDEAENRLHTAKAVMALTMGGRGRG